MITDARALRCEYVPRDLVHREGEIDQMAAALDTVLTENISIFGPSGVGKTTLAKFVVGQLEAESLNIRWGYCNCISDSTKTGVLHQLVRDSGLGRDMRRRGTPVGDFLDRIRDYDGTFVAILDEVDVLDDPEILASLADMPDVALVTICVDQDKLHRDLVDEERVRTRLRASETITLDKYSHDEMVDIIEYRVAHGLDGSRVEQEAIDYIADSAAGNARVGIALLRRSAERVAAGDASAVTPALVDATADDAREDVRDSRVRSLGTHKRALYEIVRDAGADGLDAGTLHTRYCEYVQDPRARRTMRRYLDSLERYDLIESGGGTKGTRYYSR